MKPDQWLPVALKERLYHIDALRAFLMSYGVVLHANTFMKNDFSFFIGESSHIFRMQTFFVISGFFTAMILSKTPHPATYGKRLFSFLVPFCFFMILFNPLANYVLTLTAGTNMTFIEFLHHGPPAGIEPPLGITWHLHLWFLVVLSVFTCLYPLIRKVLHLSLLQKILQRTIDPERRASLSFFLIASLVALTSVFLRGVYFVLAEASLSGHPLNHILVSILQFLPFFAVGCSLFFYRPLFTLFHTLFPLQTGIVFGATAITYHFLPALEATYGDAVSELILRLVSGYCSIYSAALLIKLFSLVFRNPGRWIKLQAEAAYTVYLLHLYILIGLYYFFYTPGHSSALLFMGAILFTYPLCLALHHFVVARFRLTRMLINGKLRG